MRWRRSIRRGWRSRRRLPPCFLTARRRTSQWGCADDHPTTGADRHGDAARYRRRYARRAGSRRGTDGRADHRAQAGGGTQADLRRRSAHPRPLQSPARQHRPVSGKDGGAAGGGAAADSLARPLPRPARSQSGLIPRAPVRLPSERGLDAALVAVFIDEYGDVAIAEAGQVVAQHVGLLAAEFEQERTAAAEEAGDVGKHAAENLGAVGAAIVGQGRLERERVALQQRQRRRWHVRRDADHDIDPSFERAWQGCKQIALVCLHSVRGRAGDRTLVDVGRDNARAWPGRGQGPGDRSSPGADIDGRTGRRQPIDGPPCQRLALPPRNINTRINANLHPAEGDTPGNPGQWLAGQPALDERAEELDITGGAGEKLVGLLLRGDKAGAREQRRERLEVKR